MFGGLSRVYEGMTQTDTEFRAVPAEARKEALQMRDEIYNKARVGGKSKRAETVE